MLESPLYSECAMCVTGSLGQDMTRAMLRLVVMRRGGGHHIPEIVERCGVLEVALMEVDLAVIRETDQSVASATVLPARFSPAVAAAETAATARRLWTGFVHGEVSAAKLRSVQHGDRVLRLLIRAHFDEPESAGAPGRLIAHDLR